MANDIQALRGIIFSALEGLTDKQNPLPIDRAKAIAELSQVVINTAKVELDFMRATKAAGTGFIGEALPPPTGDGDGTATATGTKHVTKVPGGTVTQHRMR